MEELFDAKDYIDEMKAQCEKVLTYLKGELSNIRAGRANPHILDKITVEYYGTMTPINQIANITIPEARMLCITPWDASVVKNTVKAIQESDIGINPSDDGKIIRLVFPMLNEERRRELVKQVKQIAESQKVVMRNARRDCLDSLKNLKKNGNISEDELSTYEKQVQTLLDGFIVKVDEVLANKEKEIMEI
ncbi:MAG: ribosome recycling factor [Clostridia bacterium]|nr:ribosome recycling factor [Clostridia bacterium]